MAVVIDTHAAERMEEREAREDEVVATVEQGEQFPAKREEQVFAATFLIMRIGTANTTQPNK